MIQEEAKPKRFWVCAGISKKYAVLDEARDERVEEFDDYGPAIQLSNELNEAELNAEKNGFETAKLELLVVPLTNKAQRQELERLFQLQDKR